MKAWLLLAALLVWMVGEAYLPRLKKDTIPLAPAHAGLAGLKIAFVSDIHLGPLMPPALVARLVRRVNRAGADIIILGGDYVFLKRKYIEPCFRELAALQAPLGVWGVLGNHDHWADAEASRQAMEAAGISLLDDTARRIDWRAGSFWLTGPAPTPGQGAEGGFTIMAAHDPQISQWADMSRVNLTLCGHTHGGQITLFGLWSPLVPALLGQKYRAGMVREAGGLLLVSRGAGFSGLPLRLFCRAEINLLTLTRPRPGKDNT